MTEPLEVLDCCQAQKFAHTRICILEIQRQVLEPQCSYGLETPKPLVLQFSRSSLAFIVILVEVAKQIGVPIVGMVESHFVMVIGENNGYRSYQDVCFG